MINTRKFAAIAEASNGQQVLFFIESDGDQFSLHQIAEFDVGQIDLKITLSSDDEDAVYALVDSFGTERADKVLVEISKLLGE